MENVANISLVGTTSATIAELGLFTGTVNDGVGFGWNIPRDSTQGTNITAGLGVVESTTTNSYTYIHELLHTLGLDHPGHGTGNDAASTATP